LTSCDTPTGRQIRRLNAVSKRDECKNLGNKPKAIRVWTSETVLTSGIIRVDRDSAVMGAKPINLALQGGGAHGAFTWGVLDRLLEDSRIEFEGISATSSGAMNAAVMANGL